MFNIQTEKFGPLTLTKLVNDKTSSFFSFIPGFGAAINDLVIYQKGKSFKLIDSSKNYQDLLTSGTKMFKGSKLFPFPNRIKNGRFVWHGKKYQLPINFPSENHAIHGLVLGKKFKIVSKKCSENEASIELTYYYHGEMPGYPFKYRLQVIFSFSRINGVKCHTIVANEDEIAIPIGDGWHPYFQTGTKIDHLYLKLPSTEILEVDKRMIPIGNRIKSDKFASLTEIGKTIFDTCYKIGKSKKGIAEVKLNDPRNNINLTIWQETGRGKYNYLQIYTPPSRTSIAVEPMTCAPDAFNNREGLITLEPGKNFTASFGIKLTS
jgi:aldose 1-epimerase